MIPPQEQCPISSMVSKSLQLTFGVNMQRVEIGLIGGSQLYKMEALKDIQEHEINTPFGRTSDSLVTGKIEGIPVVFIARHGRARPLIPSEVPCRANIFALKQMGVRYLLSFSAVGSLCEQMGPSDLVLPDQFIDLTKSRENTFFGNGVVAHVSMAMPVCSVVCNVIKRAIEKVEIQTGRGIKRHDQGTYVCIEGPQFSTIAESNWYRTMGASIIGMSSMPEAKLAREAQIAYATLAMVTDFDCWRPSYEPVTANEAQENHQQNIQHLQNIAVETVKLLHLNRPSSMAHTALKNASFTTEEKMDAKTTRIVSTLLK